jgi:transcription initiation factor TFIIIB Brf1 subunit/transcription initiation factor TFIIB
MICPKCNFEQSDGNIECLKCGIVFEKYRQYQDPEPTKNASPTEYEERAASIGELSRNLLFYVKPETNPLILGVRVLFFLVIFVWGLKFIFTSMETNCVGESFWHLVNLPFHEAGHIIFRPFGRFMTSLGGSLGQLLMPLTCLIAFLIKTRDTFAASFALWWLGESFMDLAPYINDARSLTLPLLGGNTGNSSPYGFHDWEFILKESGLIHYDHVLANSSYMLGTILMIVSFLWGGYILFIQYKHLNMRRATSTN